MSDTRWIGRMPGEKLGPDTRVPHQLPHGCRAGSNNWITGQHSSCRWTCCRFGCSQCRQRWTSSRSIGASVCSSVVRRLTCCAPTSASSISLSCRASSCRLRTCGTAPRFGERFDGLWGKWRRKLAITLRRKFPADFKLIEQAFVLLRLCVQLGKCIESLSSYWSDRSYSQRMQEWIYIVSLYFWSKGLLAVSNRLPGLCQGERPLYFWMGLRLLLCRVQAKWKQSNRAPILTHYSRNATVHLKTVLGKKCVPHSRLPLNAMSWKEFAW